MMFITQSIAYTLTQTAYVASIKSLGIVISVFVGGRMLKEDNVIQRTFSALIVVIGVVLIALKG